MSRLFGATVPGTGYRGKRRRRSGNLNPSLTKRAIGIGACLAVTVVLAWVAGNRVNVPRAPVAADEEDLIPPVVTGRQVYPYSVLPGGVLDSEELVRKLRNDQVAARHYSGFEADRAVLIHASFRRESAHVSYRSGDRIYWTRKKVRIEPNELLLTDGKSFVRTRCGNRLADTPQQPIAKDEPTEEALLYTPPPISNRILRLPGDLEDPPALKTETLYKLPNISTVAVLDRLPPGPPIVLGGARRGVAPVGNIPEPAPIVYLGSGILFLALMAVARLRKHS